MCHVHPLRDAALSVVVRSPRLEKFTANISSAMFYRAIYEKLLEICWCWCVSASGALSSSLDSSGHSCEPERKRIRNIQASSAFLTDSHISSVEISYHRSELQKNKINNIKKCYTFSSYQQIFVL